MTEQTVLLVEDNPDDAALALRAFKKYNPDQVVVVAGDGVEALEYLFGEGAYSDRDVSCMPSVILSDLKMPRLDGLDLLQRVRSDPRTRLIPVVMLTTSSEEHDLAGCYASGCNSYVCKPVNFRRFVELMKELAAYWLTINEVAPCKGKRI